MKNLILISLITLLLPLVACGKPSDEQEPPVNQEGVVNCAETVAAHQYLLKKHAELQGICQSLQDKVAVRGQYIQEAIKSQQDILIYHDHGSMRIPNHKLYDMLVAKSDKKMHDKFGKLKPDFLYYFNWQPDVQQGVLV